MIISRLKKVVAAIVIMFAASSLFAVEEYVSRIYKDLDVIFIEKSSDKLNDVLQKNQKDKYYTLIENYAEKKIRRLIVVNDYQFALDAIVVVIENNLDNEEAIEMYSIIAEAYEVQLAYEEEQEQLRLAEEQRIQNEKEKQRGAVDKEYVAAKTSKGGSVYVTGKEAKLTSYNCDFSFGMVSLSALTDIKSGYNALNYGLSANLNYVYQMENYMFGMDAFADFQFLGLGDNASAIPLITEIEFAMKMASPKLSKNLFARVGLDVMNVTKTAGEAGIENIGGNIFSPIIGLQVNKLPLGGIHTTVNLDYLAGTLWNPEYTFGAQAAVDFILPYAQMEKMNLNFHIGVRDKVLIKNGGGLENRATLIFAIGAENAIR